jgi:hypothetical protein
VAFLFQEFYVLLFFSSEDFFAPKVTRLLRNKSELNIPVPVSRRQLQAHHRMIRFSLRFVFI